jgi:hypothetical protein
MTQADVFPDPLSPTDCDLRDFPFMPLDIARLFNSEFHALADDTAWRAGLTLWLKSFHQVPSGSIPDDDISLTRLAELGRDVKTWKKIRAMALHGWIKCSDGRLYHPVVAEKAAEAWKGKMNQRSRTGKARLQAMLVRLSKVSDTFEFSHIESNVQTLLSELSQSLSQTEFNSIKKSVTDSVTEAQRKREGKGEGKGKGQLYSVPNGTDGKPSDSTELPISQDEAKAMTKTELWASGKSLLQQAGMPAAQCGSFVGKLVNDYGDDIVIEAVRSTVVNRPADPASYLKAICQRAKGERPNRQTSLEQSNQAVADRLAAAGENA